MLQSCQNILNNYLLLDSYDDCDNYKVFFKRTASARIRGYSRNTGLHRNAGLGGGGLWGLGDDRDGFGGGALGGLGGVLRLFTCMTVSWRIRVKCKSSGIQHGLLTIVMSSIHSALVCDCVVVASSCLYVFCLITFWLPFGSRKCTMFNCFCPVFVVWFRMALLDVVTCVVRMLW